MNYRRHSLKAAAAFIALIALLLLPVFQRSASAAEGDGMRVLTVKPRIVSKTASVHLRDVVANYQVLSDEEKEFEITEAPVSSDENLTIVDLAFMLQKYPSLMSARLKGPKTVVLQKIADNSAVEKAKSELVKQIRGMSPWKDWEIDVLLSNSDESLISKASPFSKLEILPSENKTMIGPVNLNVAFLDENGRQTMKGTLNPTILKKVNVVVLNSNGKQGQLLQESFLKKVPMWLGPENKDYISDFNDCVGRELARSMSTGEIMRASDILNPVCAKKGDIIWVECRSGSLMVKLAVTALDGGRQGDMIKVVNKSTQKIFTVELTGERYGVFRIGG